jgi:hypothetical protein
MARPRARELGGRARAVRLHARVVLLEEARARLRPRVRAGPAPAEPGRPWLVVALAALAVLCAAGVAANVARLAPPLDPAGPRGAVVRSGMPS